MQREGDRIINQKRRAATPKYPKEIFPTDRGKLQGEYRKLPLSPASLTEYRHNPLKGCVKKLILQELANLATKPYSHILDI